MILFSHPTGNPNVRNALAALEDEGLLNEFHTGLGFSKNAWFLKLLPKNLSARLQRRSYDLPATRVLSHPLKDSLRLLGFQPSSNGLSAIDQVYIDLDRSVARKLSKASVRKHVSAIYSYEDACADSFKVAEDFGIHRIYELPIAYWKAARDIYETEAQLNPEWAMTLEGLNEPELKLIRKDEELSRAEVIITASRFTESSLRYFSQDKLNSYVNPYGSPKPISKLRARKTNKALQVLFVGGLSQRKGLSYLFEAMDNVRDAELTVVGRYNGSCPVLETELQKHRWISSMPHAELVEFMSSFDVMVFPSLFEGFGLVLLEAMSRGLSIITTPNTAGPDLIEEGVEGFIVPIRDSDAISQKLEYLSENPNDLEAMKQNALAKTKLFTWKNYQDRLIHIITEHTQD